MDATTSIPLKRCSRKENCVHPEAVDGWLPATTVYFVPSKRGMTKLAPNCRACKSADAKAHYAKNKERIKERVKRNTERNTDKIREYQRQYRNEHRDELNEYYRERYRRIMAENPERIRERTRTWRRNNPEKRSAMHRRQVAKNPEKFRAYTHKRLARKRALPDTFTAEQWEHALAYFDRRCAYCGLRLDNFHLDHFIPLSSPECTGTIATNVVPACGACNTSKNAAMPDEWLFWRFGEWRMSAILEHIQAYFDSLDG